MEIGIIQEIGDCMNWLHKNFMQHVFVSAPICVANCHVKYIIYFGFLNL